MVTRAMTGAYFLIFANIGSSHRSKKRNVDIQNMQKIVNMPIKAQKINWLTLCSATEKRLKEGVCMAKVISAGDRT